jgi:hypothetical protein
MIRCIDITPNRTYATRANAIKAVEKMFGDRMTASNDENLHFFIHTTPEGRFFPVFFGERALRAMMHTHFNVVA